MKTLKLKQPQIIGLKELRENMEEYISRVKKGASFTIARRSQPIFEISPVGVMEDESLWETIVDFTTIDPEGVSAKEVLRSLKKLHGTN
jgi:antitoxin (DNA-binding transcriptional repressor) of toxin-antitoxin stability system